MFGKNKRYIELNNNSEYCSHESDQELALKLQEDLNLISLHFTKSFSESDFEYAYGRLKYYPDEDILKLEIKIEEFTLQWEGGLISFVKFVKMIKNK